MDNLEHKLVWSFKGDRNLFTNPLDTGDILNGWENDYFVEVKAEGVDGNTLYVSPNGVITNDYRKYSMVGTATTAVATVDDSAVNSSIRIIDSFATPELGLGRLLISSEANSEKYLDILSGGSNGINYQVRKTGAYWKNILDNLTKLQFRTTGNSISYIDIKIYQIPKGVNLDQYDLIDEVVFENRSTDIVFDNLNGDVDEEYLIEWDNNDSLAFRINGNASNVYTAQGLTQNGGVLSAINGTATATSFISSNGSARLFATSGKDRLFVSSASSPTTESGYDQAEGATWYAEQIANVTSITATNLSSETGKVSLYKKKPHKTIDPVPMDTLFEYEVDGGFSGGITINNLQGDRIDGAIKIEYIGSSSSASNMDFRLNSVSTGITRQTLNATSSSVDASSDSRTAIELHGSLSSDTSFGVCWIYPKSGSARPVLGQYYGVKQNIREHYHVDSETIAEVSQIDLFSNNTALLTGTLRISVPKGTTWTTKPALTVN